MGKITIKSPSSDDIFKVYKQKMANNKRFQKLYAIKGAVFDVDKITAAESVQGVEKGAILYFRRATKIGPAGVKGKKLQQTPAKIHKVTFFEFGSGNIDKANWKHGEAVPHLSSLQEETCPKCKGTGGTTCGSCKGTGIIKCDICQNGQSQCKNCSGSGKIDIILDVIDANGKKSKADKVVQCDNCFGSSKMVCEKCGGSSDLYCRTCSGTGQRRCSECDGYGTLFSYSILPVPFTAVDESDDILFSSERLGKNVEAEMGNELEQTVQMLGCIEIQDKKELNKKTINANLGYLDKKVWKVIKDALREIDSADKTEDDNVVYPLYLIPLITLNCTSPKKKAYNIYALGTEEKFRVFGDI